RRLLPRRVRPPDPGDGRARQRPGPGRRHPRHLRLDREQRPVPDHEAAERCHRDPRGDRGGGGDLRDERGRQRLPGPGGRRVLARDRFRGPRVNGRRLRPPPDRLDLTVWRLLGVGLALLATLAACESAPAPSDAGPVVERGIANGFVLETSVPRRVWSSTDIIPVTTTLTWTGPAASQRVGTATDGPVMFGLKQLDGTLEMGGAQDAVCDHKSYDRGVATPIPFAKS